MMMVKFIFTLHVRYNIVLNANMTCKFSTVNYDD